MESFLIMGQHANRIPAFAGMTSFLLPHSQTMFGNAVGSEALLRSEAKLHKTLMLPK